MPKTKKSKYDFLFDRLLPPNLSIKAFGRWPMWIKIGPDPEKRTLETTPKIPMKKAKA